MENTLGRGMAAVFMLRRFNASWPAQYRDLLLNVFSYSLFSLVIFLPDPFGAACIPGGVSP
jgi:hypothetical protein